MKRFALLAAAAVACAASAQPSSPSRGELLYENHCSACHTTQMHWRDRRVAADWAGLRVQVRRWQATAQLNWSDDEVDDVARFLNARFYRYEEPPRRLSSAGR